MSEIFTGCKKAQNEPRDSPPDLLPVLKAVDHLQHAVSGAMLPAERPRRPWICEAYASTSMASDDSGC